MKTVNMHEAKTHLSKLVDAATRGEPFIIAKAGKPLVKVTMVEDAPERRMGFLKDEIAPPPADFDDMAADEIRALFEGRPE